MVTTSKLNVRAVPAGKNIGFQKMNAQGTIVSGPVLKNGYRWYSINYDISPDGWSAQDWLEKVKVVIQSGQTPSSSVSSSTNTAASFNALTPEQRQVLITSLLQQIEILKEKVRGLGR